MEITTRLFRALANDTRIRILRVLSCLGEQSVAAIARAVVLKPNLVSGHLGVLAVSGVVWKRRSGRTVYYSIAESPSRSTTREVLAVLRDVFGRVRTKDPRQVAASDQGPSKERSDEALFMCFTGFTHPRRLQLIRHLMRQGPQAVTTLCEPLSMSPQACHRHLSKLSRRGYVQMGRVGRDTVCSVVVEGDSPRMRVLRAVVAEFDGRG
ncbi:metalloregulator ArsR/SmtB family transcription factor [bacterium]|nr:metalloregulator ArsR/SmtB family transcription factor [bacterium]